MSLTESQAATLLVLRDERRGDFTTAGQVCRFRWPEKRNALTARRWAGVVRSMGGILSRLDRDGFVTWHDDPQRGWQMRYRITDKGRQALQEAGL